MLANSILTQALIKPLDQTPDKIKYLVLSDIHLGHKRNTTREIIHNLFLYFDNFSPDSPLKDLDIVFIAGDLFDQAIWFNNEDVVRIILFVRKLMSWCEYFNIKLRILEGTPSHDRSQTRNFVPIAKGFQKLDFRYIETLCIEAFYDLGITCLYIPDEFAGSAEEAQRLFQEELNKVNLEKVDIAILHGMFKYQVPEIGSDRFKFDEQFFLDRVKSFINIGHVHIHSVYERILCQGSFDRLTHGEEGPKGAMLMELHPHGNSFYFVENKTAKKFKTCHIKTPDIDKAVAQVRKMADSLPDESYLRIKATKSHPVFNVFDRIAKEYLMLSFSKITEEEANERQQLLDAQELLNIDYTPVQIHKDNIVEMIIAEVKNRNDFSSHALFNLENHLKDLIT